MVFGWSLGDISGRREGGRGVLSISLGIFLGLTLTLTLALGFWGEVRLRGF